MIAICAVAFASVTAFAQSNNLPNLSSDVGATVTTNADSITGNENLVLSGGGAGVPVKPFFIGNNDNAAGTTITIGTGSGATTTINGSTSVGDALAVGGAASIGNSLAVGGSTSVHATKAWGLSSAKDAAFDLVNPFSCDWVRRPLDVQIQVNLDF